MKRFRAQITQTVMVVLMALALSLVGFGHQVMRADAPDLAAYAMPDGTLPVLCLDEGLPGDQKGAAQAPCPACIIAAALQLPETAALPFVELSVAVVEWPAPAQTHGNAHSVRAPPARGPPPVFLI